MSLHRAKPGRQPVSYTPFDADDDLTLVDLRLRLVTHETNLTYPSSYSVYITSFLLLLISSMITQIYLL